MVALRSGLAFGSGEYTAGTNCGQDSIGRLESTFGVGGSVLLTDAAFGLELLSWGELRPDDRADGGRSWVWIVKGEGSIVRAAAGGARLAVYVVDGRGRGRFGDPIDSDGAWDIRRPICTVAEDAIDESRLCPRKDAPKTEGGGARPVISYIEVGSWLAPTDRPFSGLEDSEGKSEYEALRKCRATDAIG